MRILTETPNGRKSVPPLQVHQEPSLIRLLQSNPHAPCHQRRKPHPNQTTCSLCCGPVSSWSKQNAETSNSKGSIISTFDSSQALRLDCAYSLGDGDAERSGLVFTLRNRSSSCLTPEYSTCRDSYDLDRALWRPSSSSNRCSSSRICFSFLSLKARWEARFWARRRECTCGETTFSFPFFLLRRSWSS